MIDTKLYSLMKVVETGSYTRAAEELSLTQPAVSQHIRQLSEELKVKLFERSNNRLYLTREGETVVRYARRMLSLYENLQQSLKNEKAQVKQITVGITHTAESNFIARVLAEYANARPGVTIKLITGTLGQLYTHLKNYELDFAIVEGKIRDNSLCYLMLDTDSLILATAPDHPLAKQSMITLEQLKKEKLILRLPNSSTRNLFAASLESQNMSIEDFNVVLEIDNIATIRELVRSNFGVSVLAKSACISDLRKKRLAALPIENLTMMREINLVSLKDYEHPDVLQDIVESYNEIKMQQTNG